MKRIVRERLLMDRQWRFHPGNAADPHSDFDFGLKDHYFCKTGEPFGPLSADFDDSRWRPMDLPHDWVVELEFDTIAQDDSLNSHGYKAVGRSRPAHSVGWYRKAFMIPESDRNKRISIEFDGVYRDCMVWLNGCYLGRHWSGYSSFRHDLSDYVVYGKKNLLVVRVDASFAEGWFYEGAGIYRHVWLVKTAPVHVANLGNFVTAKPDLKGVSAAGDTVKIAAITVKTLVVNESDRNVSLCVATAILDSNARRVAKHQSPPHTLKPWAEIEVEQKMALPQARLWSVETPCLYKAVTAVKADGAVTDTTETTFGVRTFCFDKDKGFFLNGRAVKIKGVCCHQDHAGVGSALPDAIQVFRIRKLKEMGCNAYRTSHNPPTPELLDECDRQGMLVMDEQRFVGSCPEAINQLDRLVRRDRNHPSVVIWSLGNEEGGIQGEDAGRRIAASMKRLVRKLDPTRPVTVAMNNGGEGVGFTRVVDVQGWNYIRIGNIEKWHAEHPDTPIVGSEEASTLCTRGIYARDAGKGYVVAYDEDLPGWGSTAEQWWTFAAQRPWYAGGFIWTGFDYRGEPTPYRRPCINSHFGVMDTCGFPKDNFFYYRAWWTGETVLHILPHWNWAGREGQDIDVRVFSNCEEVELFLNGRGLGRKGILRNSHAKWMVPYKPGILLARGYKRGKAVATAVRETSGPAARIGLTPDRSALKADCEDVSLVEVAILDAKGRLVPIADNEVSFSVSPNARIIGVGNGNPSSHEPDKAMRRRAFNGLCLAIVQATARTGRIVLTATSPGLKRQRAILQAKPCALRPHVP